MEKKSKIALLILILLAIIILDLQFFGMYGRTTFPQDTAILYEGSYRITVGQFPYQDFFIPFGPVVFYMQAFFNLLFGSNILAMAIHAFVLTIILCIIFYFIVREEFGITMSFILALFFYLSFSGLSFHPFYNYTPYFFLFLNIFILFNYRKQEALPRYVYLISVSLGILGFYTKQDIGALHLFFLFLYFMYNYKNQWKSILLYCLLPTIIMLAGAYFFLSSLEGFQYWFNLGQFPHKARFANFSNTEKILALISSWKFYLTLSVMFFLLFGKIKNNENRRILCLFLVVSFTTIINNILSGATRQLTVMGIPLLIFFAYSLIKNPIIPLIKNNKREINIILIVVLLLTVNPFPTYGLITLNYFNPRIDRISEGCYKGFPMSENDIRGLEKIREVIEENNHDFISITEYTFLYCDYGKEPPKNLPLWFDEGVSFFEENVEDIIKTIKLNKPQVILLQDPHGHEDPSLNEKFEESFIKSGYVKKYTIYGSTTGETLTKSPITVLVKNGSNQKEQNVYNV